MNSQTPGVAEPALVVRESSDSCRFIAKCPMFPLFASEYALGIYKIHYCRGDFGECARYKQASTGTRPPDDLLPDGGLLRAKRAR